MIKLFEQYNEYNQVKEWLDEMKIRNYIINDDLTVDVNDDVDIRGCVLSEIPIQFGRVMGSFYCQNNFLKTLKGSPTYVDGAFNCSNNNLTTLEGCPKYIRRVFNFRENEITSLKGAPNEVQGHFDYYENPLPIDILDFDDVVRYGDIKELIKHQDEYGIWNNDGSLNQARFDIFCKDYASLVK